MDWKQWYLALAQKQREEYARNAGTTAGYIRVHLIGRRKIPRQDLMEKLAAGTDGRFTVTDLLAFFYRTGEADPAGNGHDSEQAVV